MNTSVRKLLAGLAVLAFLSVGQAAEKRLPATVEVSGQVTANISFPFGVVPIELKLHARAMIMKDGSVTGSGGHTAFLPPETHMENSVYDLTSAWIEGDTVVLAGTVTRSSGTALPGSPIVITADKSGNLTLQAGPMTGWPFIGQTHVFTGTGNVVVTTP